MPSFPHLPVLDFVDCTKNFETLGNLPHLPVDSFEAITRNFEVLDPSVPCLPVTSFHDATLDFEMLQVRTVEKPRPEVVQGTGSAMGTKAFFSFRVKLGTSLEAAKGIWGYEEGNWGEGTGLWAEGLVITRPTGVSLKASASTTISSAASAKGASTFTIKLGVTVVEALWGEDESEWGNNLRNWGE